MISTLVVADDHASSAVDVSNYPTPPPPTTRIEKEISVAAKDVIVSRKEQMSAEERDVTCHVS